MYFCIITIQEKICNPYKMQSSVKYYEKVITEVVRLLQEERKKRGLSNYAICKRSGISQSAPGKIEKGERRPTLETALRISDAIGVDFTVILKKAWKNCPSDAKHRPE